MLSKSCRWLVMTLVLCLLIFVSLSSALQNGDVRLVNGPSANKGRVEVYYDGVWGTVCDDSWHFRDADTICKQLDYEYAEQVYWRAFYGEGTGPIWIDQIDCNTYSQSILECEHQGWGIHNCKHREDASVDCKRKIAVKPKELPLRLSCPEVSSCGSCQVCAPKAFPDPTDCEVQKAVEGIVEAFYDDEWHPISSDGWDMNSANVVCGELGYPLAMSVPSVEELWCNWDEPESSCVGSGIDPNLLEDCQSDIEFRSRVNSTWIRELECSGKENRLLDCYFKEWGPTVSDGMSLNLATVRCGYNPHPECSKDNKGAEMYRTRGSPVPWQGRLEIRIDGEWGTISDSYWTIVDASIACRALGYGSAERPTVRASFGRGAGKVHFDRPTCEGSEKLLSECSSTRVYYYHSHASDVGVICRAPKRGEDCGVIQRSKIVSATNINGYVGNNFVEILGHAGWGLMCFESMKQEIASVICRETSQMFPFQIRKASHIDRTKKKYKCSMSCTGKEMHLTGCTGICLLTRKCLSDEAVVICSPGMPDLVPDLEAFSRSLFYIYLYGLPIDYLTCALEENCLSSSAYGKPRDHRRKLLRFSSQTMNYGTANFEPVLDRNDWQWHSCHRHYHSFEEFIHYDLIDPYTGVKAAEGHKASFCLEDSTCESGGYQRYRCGTGSQGISVNCGDLYGSHLDCQWIDITDVRTGRYILRQTVNPGRLTAESDYANNVVECTLDIWDHLAREVKDSCRLSDH